jgi:hypothetical protein
LLHFDPALPQTVKIQTRQQIRINTIWKELKKIDFPSDASVYMSVAGITN